MPNCAVATCYNYNRKTKESDIKYFGFPKIEQVAKQWESMCRRQDKINLKNATICSIHFEENCFEIPLRYKLFNEIPRKNFRTLKRDAVPTLHLPEETQDTTNKRMNRAKRKRQEQEVSELLLNTVDDESTSEDTKMISQVFVKVEQLEENEALNDKNEEITVTQLQEKVVQLEHENAVLFKENNKLQETVNALNHALRKIFTEAQIKKLMKPDTKIVHWSATEIAGAISLRSVNP